MLIQMPPSPVAANIDWDIDQPGQSNRGEFTGKRRVTLLTAAPRWYAKVTLPPILGEDRVLPWRAFAVDCDGIANSFRVVACERDQIAGVTVLVKGAGQQGHAMVTSGWGEAGTKLLRGQFVTVAGQLLMLMADAVADASGETTLAFKPYLRLSPAANAPVEVRRPYAVMSMTDPKCGWKAGLGQNYGVSFDCEESF